MSRAIKFLFAVCSIILLTGLGSFSAANGLTRSKKVLIILAHPNPESFNHAVSNTVSQRLVQRGFEVKTRDLYHLGFDPVLTLEELKNYENPNHPKTPEVLAEQTEVLWADHLVIVYPTWWWSPPAILKGYLDRVFTPDFAFSLDNDGKPQVSPLAGKTVSIIQTTGADPQFIRREEMDDAVRKLFSVGIFGFCGMEVVHHEFLMGVSGKSYEELKQVLQEVDLMVDTWF